ncbi:MAG: YceD family protein [Gammaproteobacteria bacterium]|nr:YceD family protein [Gammaproteobacteria bacterium]
MQSRLPEYCDLFQLADKSATMSGVWPIAKLPRLLALLSSDVGEAVVEFEFGKSGRTRFLKGTISADVEMECQRCLESATVSLNAEFSLALIEDELNSNKVPEEYDILVTEGRHFLPDVIEDELILVVPLVASHDYECSSYLNQQVVEPVVQQQDEGEKKPNPFAALKDLL